MTRAGQIGTGIGLTINDQMWFGQCIRGGESSTLTTSWLTMNGSAATFPGTVTASGYVGVTKSMVGLSNVDNTSDLDKPISTATQTALNAKQNTLSGTGFVKSNGGTGTISYDNNAYYLASNPSGFTSNTGTVASMGGISGSSNVNGAIITGSTLSLAPADATNGGVVTTGIQTFGGDKTFTATVTATGFFNSSDAKLKNIIERDGDTVKFTWKDKRDDKIHIGYIAQEVQEKYPDQVSEDTNGMLTVNYIEVLVAKIQELENRIKQLEK
jgi:hypothetical protein